MAESKDDNKDKFGKHLATAGTVVKAADTTANAASGFATAFDHFVQAVQGNKGVQKDIGSELIKGVIPVAMAITGATIAAVASQKAGGSKMDIAKNAGSGAMKMQSGGVTNLVAAIVGPVIQVAVDPAVMLTKKANEFIQEKTGKDVVGKLTGVAATTATVAQGAKGATNMAVDAHTMVNKFVDNNAKKKAIEANKDPADAAIGAAVPTVTMARDSQQKKSETPATLPPEASVTSAAKPKRPGGSSSV